MTVSYSLLSQKVTCIEHCAIRLVDEFLSFICYDLVVSFSLTSKRNESQGLVQIPSVLQFGCSDYEACLGA